MQKAKILSYSYEPSDSIEIQGNRKKIQSYLDKGYSIKENRNGYWVLIKPARVIFCIETVNQEIAVMDMKEDILYYYGRQRISKKIVDNFAKAVKDGKINIYYENGEYFVK